jgi:5-formyltetrahydrofolate cyclo-ligase
MNDVLSQKKAARDAASSVRAALHARGTGAARQAAGHALELIGRLRDVRIVSAYLPTQTEFDPRPSMLALIGLGYRICVPVIEGKGLPLGFRIWTPGAALARGAYGVETPVDGEEATPDALLVPLLAYDRNGYRLGYGGGYYDRTIAAFRARRAIPAIGLAYSGQEVEAVPRESLDARLDALVTEAGVKRFG